MFNVKMKHAVITSGEVKRTELVFPSADSSREQCTIAPRRLIKEASDSGWIAAFVDGISGPCLERFCYVETFLLSSAFDYC